MTTPTKITSTRRTGIFIVIAVLLFIIWGLWMAYHPAPVPLQGQVEAHVINVSPKISARIATLKVREGQRVEKGEVLLTLDSPELQAKLAQAGAAQAAADARSNLVNDGARPEDIQTAKANWEKAAAGAALADKTYRRINALYKEGLVSLQRNDEAQTNFLAAQQTELAAKAQYASARTGARTQEIQAAIAIAKQAAGGFAEVNAAALELELRAPLAAEVEKIILQPGELAGAGFPVLTLVDLNDVWVVFNVREDDFSGIKIGALLEGSVPALDNKPVRFLIDTISPRGDYATWRATRQSSGYDVRTFEVRARPQTPVAGLRPGMSVLVVAH